MSDHVHVRVHRGLGISAEGELSERFECACGESWTRAYPADSRPQQD